MLNARIHPRPSWFPSVRQKDWILNWQVVICIGIRWRIWEISRDSLSWLGGETDHCAGRVWVWPEETVRCGGSGGLLLLHRTHRQTTGHLAERGSRTTWSVNIWYLFFYRENFKENSKPSNWLGEASATNLVWSSVGLKKRIFSLSWSKHCDSNTSKEEKWKKIFLRVLWQLW